jgi:hypothetical protein
MAFKLRSNSPVLQEKSKGFTKETVKSIAKAAGEAAGFLTKLSPELSEPIMGRKESLAPSLREGLIKGKMEDFVPSPPAGPILAPNLVPRVTRRKAPMEKAPMEPPTMQKKTAAWTRKEGKDPKGGLNAKGVASYRKENPGSKLQTAVTKKPSELKPGSKDAKRRKSFCARMSGMPGPMKKPNGEPTRKKLALDKWNC